MAALEPPDNYYFSAAEGWLVLGSYSDALEDLARIAPSSQNRPDVLLLRWHVCAKMKDWKTCAEIGRELVEAAPGEISNWQNYANALFYDKRFQEAFDVLFPSLEKFPTDWSIPYNLACYQCQLGKLEEALTWLKMALALGDAGEVKKHAMNDPDLDPLRASLLGL